MKKAIQVGCPCGQTRIEVEGEPIASVECCCESCREAGQTLERLPGEHDVLTAYGATPFVMVRKDRVRVLAGADTFRALRLSPKSSTKRVVATCCNAPAFLEFEGGHWLSLYAQLWPNDAAPSPQMRTMTSDLPPGHALPDDIPNAKKHSIRFFAKLLGAWAAMGFRVPTMPPVADLDEV